MSATGAWVDRAPAAAGGHNGRVHDDLGDAPVPPADPSTPRGTGAPHGSGDARGSADPGVSEAPAQGWGGQQSPDGENPVDLPIAVQESAGDSSEGGYHLVGHRSRRHLLRAPRRSLPGRIGATLALLAVLAVAAAAALVPMPFVVESPGPTVNVLAPSQGEAMISISGTDPTTGGPVQLDPIPQADDGTGALRMVTVYESGGPGNRLNAIELVQAWLDHRDAIVPFDQAYPGDITQEQVDQAAAAQMASSQSTAGVAALEELGWSVPGTVTVEGAVPGSDAEGKVEQGQTMVSLTTPDGTVHDVDSASVPFSVMRTQPVGARVTLTLEKDGATSQVDITSVSGGPGTAGSKLGIYLSADVQMPLDIAIHLEKVGGPSAGMMFALGIVDRLTPGDMTGGKSIAGTGALAYDGGVEPIGGIRQKMWGAVRDGATWFLAPATNCDEVVGHVPEGLKVAKVSTLSEARSAVEAIADDRGDTLATCTQADADALQSGAGD